jgi:hypothetical protein
MPNWCDNEIVIKGSPEVLAEIDNIISNNEDGFQMGDFVPLPEHLRDTTSSGGSDKFVNALAGDTTTEYDNWYDWSIANWGTKWDVSDAYRSNDVGQILLSYQTAWAPNINFWAQFTEKYPVEVEHRYYEEGVCFIGEATIKDGEIDDYCVDIDEAIYKQAGVILEEDGTVNWELGQDYSLADAFPLRRN